MAAQRQKLLEHHLRRHAYEFHEFRVGLLVRFIDIGIVASGSRNLGEIADDFPNVAGERAQIRDLTGPQTV